MAGTRLWRCSRCEAVASVIDGPLLLCGKCFYRKTVDRIMAAAFVPDAPAGVTAPARSPQEKAAGRGYSSP